MKYRKKPVVVEAFRWTGDYSRPDNPDWINEALKDGDVEIIEGEMIINTLEGTMLASLGDYIIQGIKGEIYPCKPDIFEATYERVEICGRIAPDNYCGEEPIVFWAPFDEPGGEDVVERGAPFDEPAGVMHHGERNT